MDGRIFKKAVLVKEMMRYTSESVVDVDWLLGVLLVGWEKYQEFLPTSDSRRNADKETDSADHDTTLQL